MEKPNNSNRPSISDLSPIPKPEGRFNDWGERKWIAISNEKQEAVDRELAGLALSSRARALCRAARLTDSAGVEFVFISNVQFPTIVLPESGIQIVPCFLPLDPANPKTEDRQAAMMKWGQFIFDGWVPIDEWTPTRLEEVVSALDDLVSLFSVIGRYYAYWEPKYPSPIKPIPSHLASRHEFQSLIDTLGIIDGLPQADREAISRSVAWISNALRNAPVQRFLLLFVSIEALATYIERESASDSPLRAFAGDRLSRPERKRRREACIKKTLESEIEPTQAVQQAYFECVVGSRAMLEDNLNRVLGDSQASQVLFGEKVSGKTLWDLRNDIAHGSLNVLSETETRFVSSRAGILEDISRSYVRAIFAALARTNYFARPRRPVFTVPLSQATGSPETEYMGPTDMAEYYANVEALSASFVRVRFGD